MQPVIRKFYLLKNILAYCGYSLTSPFFLLFSAHKHCNSTATNSNSKNARSRIVVSLCGSVVLGTKEDESCTGRVWAVGFHHIMAHTRLARILKLMNRLFFKFPNFFRPQYRGPPVFQTQEKINWSAGLNKIFKNKGWGSNHDIIFKFSCLGTQYFGRSKSTSVCIFKNHYTCKHDHNGFLLIFLDRTANLA